MKTRNEVGQYRAGKSRKGGLIFIGIIVIVSGLAVGINKLKNGSLSSYTAITATSTVNMASDTSDADIARQTKVYEQGLVLAKQKKQLDSKYKSDSDTLEKQIEQNEKDQMVFQSTPQS